MKINLIIGCCLILFSCGGSKSDDSAVINLNGVSGEITERELIDKYDYLMLENSDESMFGHLSQLEIYEDFYYILDEVMMKRIYVFNKDGSFHHTIGQLGNGPGEYINIEDFTIDKQKGQIIILAHPSTVYIYDLKGEFIESKKIGESLFWNIRSYENGYVCSTNHQTYTEGDDAFLLYIFDKDFNLKEKLVPVLPVYVQIPPFVSKPLKIANKDIIYFDNFTSTIYFLPVDNPADYHSVCLEYSTPVPNEVWADGQTFFNTQNDYSFVLESNYEDETLWVLLNKQGKLNICQIDFTTGKKRIAELNGWFPNILTYQDGYFYSSADPEMIQENKDYYYPIENSKYSFTDESNRLITKYKIKNIIE